MNADKLEELANLLAHVARGGEWECEWEEGWGHPCGRDIEYCLQNRIGMRAVGAVQKPVGDGGPAFPNWKCGGMFDGMTLRDWFAGMALQGQLASDNPHSAIPSENVAFYAWEIADAMLAARDGKGRA